MRQRIIIEILEPRTFLSASPVPIASLFNTGVATNSANGDPNTLVMPGGVDPHYRLNGGSPFVTIENGFPIESPFWIADNSTSEWISPHANENSLNGDASSEPAGTYTYETTFNLTGVDPNTASISGDIASDDLVDAILINGQSIGTISQKSGDFDFSPFSITSGFVSGINSIEIEVNNIVTKDPNPTGLRVKMSGSVIAAPSITGTVVDADGNPLHGVKVDAGSLLPVYTDHDPTTGALDSNIDGSFNIPIPEGDSLPSMLIVVAKDIDGHRYDQTVEIPSDGDVGEIQLENFSVIDNGSASQIHLLKDMDDPSDSDTIMRRAATDPIATSARYEEEVEAVSEKLASLGFRQDNGTAQASGQDASPLTPIDSWTSESATTPGPAERAMLLFQDLEFAGGSSSVFKKALNGNFSMGVNGSVDQQTLDAINSLNGVVWLLNDDTAKSQAPNSFTYESGNQNPWMNAAMVEKLSVLSGILASKGISGLTLNSDSAATGGRTNVPQGQSHATGSETDISWVTTDGGPGQGSFYQAINGKTPTLNPTTGVPKYSQEGITWNPVPSYSRKLTRKLLENILNSSGPSANQVLFNDPAFLNPSSPQYINSALLTGYVGHADHIHVGIVVPALGSVALKAETSGAPSFPPS